ncbi:glutathione peroxidase-like protein [Dinothrombium tinctorium]|uniref:glutathione peroxidase n=1 Tax=Dinothrombium tinctorium TaxID=1965070 RepID=A0A443RAL1_9ACAR|nr:glutathione peroxidase-like protein [Dinothrombium tinctorium]
MNPRKTCRMESFYRSKKVIEKKETSVMQHGITALFSTACYSSVGNGENMKPLLLLSTYFTLSYAQYLVNLDANKEDFKTCFVPTDNETIYDHSIQSLNETTSITFNDYRDKVLLLVNQEPGSNAKEILNGIKYVRPGNGFVPNFQLTKKVEVNGKNQNPIYVFLKKSCPATKDEFSNRAKLYYDQLHSRDVRWNWEKFLIEPFSGIPFKRYAANFEPKNIAYDIELLISHKLAFIDSENVEYNVTSN